MLRAIVSHLTADAAGSSSKKVRSGRDFATSGAGESPAMMSSCSGTNASAKADFGLFGLGVMGQNVALNVAEHGFSIAVYNRTLSKVDTCLSRAEAELGEAAGNMVGCFSAEEFIASLSRPRKVMFLVTAGPVVDIVINQFADLMEPGDILIDGGNELFTNSEARAEMVSERGIMYMAMGVSGGEYGARYGPSLMPGGPAEGYESLKPIFEKIAAQTDSGPCVTHVGSGSGCGNYVKMVHNGIEYGDMQLISEAYTILKSIGGMSNEALADTFERWNTGILDSFLIEITADILRKRDEDIYMDGEPVTEGTDSSRYLVDVILDAIGNKGTGKMTAQEAAERASAAPTIASALDTRFISFEKGARSTMAAQLSGPPVATVQSAEVEQLCDDVESALYCSKICSYAQGMNLIRAASDEFSWGIDLGECARIWKGGCIIRAAFLDKIKSAYDNNPALENLLIDPGFMSEVLNRQEAWRRVVGRVVASGLPCPAFGASLSYFDMCRTEELSGASLVQAQRDYFGSHTFERKDQARDEFYHCLWTEDHSPDTGF